MAPTTQIETVTVVRPLKVMALVCGVLAIILLIISTASTAWLEAEGYRQGLWEECEWDPRDIDNTMNCRANPQKDWILACASLSIIAMLVVCIGTILTGIGLVTNNANKKYIYYRIAMYLMFFAVVCMVIGLIVFPAKFMTEINERGKTEWFFAWAYGVAWGGAIFIFGAAILLLLDKESEEIYYREKTYYDNETET